MNGNSRAIFYSAAALVLITCTVKLFASPASAVPGKAQITILYDAFGNIPGMQKDWGYSALIEYAGKRILFDAGNNPETVGEVLSLRHSGNNHWSQDVAAGNLSKRNLAGGAMVGTFSGTAQFVKWNKCWDLINKKIAAPNELLNGPHYQK